MEKSLSFSDLLVGVGIFTVELIKVATLRLLFIIYVMLISLVFFPLMAGIFLTALIVTIPLSYLIFSVPALLLGLSISLFMIMFRPHIEKGGFVHVVFGTIMAPAIVFLPFYLFNPNLLTKIMAVFFPHQHNFDVLVGLSWFICIVSVAWIIFGGGAIAGFLQKNVIKNLLAAPTSVRQQLMAYKRKTGG